MTDLPAHLQNRSSRKLAERTIQNLGMGSPPYLSIMGGRFTLIDVAGNEQPVLTVDQQTGMPYVDCVVIDTGDHESKIYYVKPYDPNSGHFAPPDCWSDNGIAPSRNASVPQSALCGTCDKAVWGSAISRVSGKGIPACSKNQKLALMVPGIDTLFLLRVPPNSLANLRDYLNKFRGQNFDLADVITRVSFEKDVLGTLTFRGANFIDEAIAQRREAAWTAKATDMLVGRGDLPREGLPAMAPRQNISASPENRQDPMQTGVSGVGQTQASAAMPQGYSAGAPATFNVPPAAAETPPARARGRPRNTSQQEVLPPGQPAQAGQQAPFRPNPSLVNQPNGNGAPFGIQNPVAPDAALAAQIDSVFK